MKKWEITWRMKEGEELQTKEFEHQSPEMIGFVEKKELEGAVYVTVKKVVYGSKNGKEMNIQ